jgi:hypothetical protein
MAVDQNGVEELLDWVDPDFIRYCPMHRVPFVPDDHMHRYAHTRCPVGGESLQSYFARFRDQGGTPVPTLEPLMDMEWW